MGVIGAEDLVPFGGHIPKAFQADDEEIEEHQRSLDDGHSAGLHVVGADPVPPSTSPDRQTDPDIGTVPGSPNRQDPDTPDQVPDPGHDEESTAALQQSRMDDEQPVDVQDAVDEVSDGQSSSS